MPRSQRGGQDVLPSSGCSSLCWETVGASSREVTCEGARGEPQVLETCWSRAASLVVVEEPVRERVTQLGSSSDEGCGPTGYFQSVTSSVGGASRQSYVLFVLGRGAVGWGDDRS